MWYNYYDDPVGETEKEAREFAKNEMSKLDLIDCMLEYFGAENISNGAYHNQHFGISLCMILQRAKVFIL